jgi:hypothetical protein
MECIGIYHERLRKRANEKMAGYRRITFSLWYRAKRQGRKGDESFNRAIVFQNMLRLIRGQPTSPEFRMFIIIQNV